MQKIYISIILACYNEGPTLEKSVNSIVRTLNKLGKNWEIVFVEDKSQDSTGETVKKLVTEINESFLRIKNSRRRQGFGGQAKVIFHKKNEGRGRSVSDGIRASIGEVCGYLDVDLEVSPEYIPLFVSEIENGSDMVVGRRFYESNPSSLGRVIASRAYSLIVKKILNLPAPDTEAGYKFFSRKKITPILSKVQDKRWFWDTEICAIAYWSNLKISEIPVLFIKRMEKKSTVRLIPDSLEYFSKIIKFRLKNSKKINLPHER